MREPIRETPPYPGVDPICTRQCRCHVRAWPLGDSKTQALALCAAMQSEGIMVFTVGFDVGAAAETFLKACAGSDDLYYEASTDDELIKVYATLAARLLGTSLTH